MRGVCMSSNGTSTKGFAELNHHAVHEQKEVRYGVAGGGHGLAEEDAYRINDDLDPKILVHQSQGTQGSVVRWERFLPFRSLKVLLVEFDDSTRHIVGALLRNCSYEVTAVANGIEAWKIIQDLSNHIDLVLTEVAMPYLSGIGLLNKIANHKTCKNIPVIMMSSNDSVDIVFKCLSKGARDFLVKPIRKNELKNLWQHVWRKCQNSSGSGSESDMRTQKLSKSKNVEGTGDNNISNDGNDIASNTLNDRNGSDNGSGTQSCWTKRAVEVDRPRPISPRNELADASDSTCARVIHFTSEAFSNNWVPTTDKMELPRNNEFGDIAMGKDLEIGVPISSDTQMEEQSKEVFLSKSEAQERINLESEIENHEAKSEKHKMQLNGDPSSDKSSEEVADLIGMINCDISKTNGKEGKYDHKEVPSLELSLKRTRDVGEVEDATHEHNVLKRPHLSAFLRYNSTVSTANQTPTGNVGSCSPNGNNSSEAEKPENLEKNSDETPNRNSNGSSNKNDVGSTTNTTFAKSASDKPAPKTTLNLDPSSAFQPLKNSHTASAEPLVANKGDVETVDTALAQANSVQVQHHHHYHHHHHHHVHNKAPTGLTKPVEVDQANYSLEGGNNNGSNGQNGACTEGTNTGTENILTANFGSGSAIDQRRYTRRMAALNKFRQKRKERCFEKKVRYQNRKKLAEQRPRVRGQFVRQHMYDNKSTNANS